MPIDDAFEQLLRELHRIRAHLGSLNSKLAADSTVAQSHARQLALMTQQLQVVEEMAFLLLGKRSSSADDAYLFLQRTIGQIHQMIQSIAGLLESRLV